MSGEYQRRYSPAISAALDCLQPLQRAIAELDDGDEHDRETVIACLAVMLLDNDGVSIPERARALRFLRKALPKTYH
jgi:hypothetical protein